MKNVMKVNIADAAEEYYQYLERADKATILVQIKSNLLDEYNNISILELEILANNIYDFSCLMANGVPESKIHSYISLKSQYYSEKISEEEREKLVTHEYTLLKKITQKFIKLIRSTLGGENE